MNFDAMTLARARLALHDAIRTFLFDPNVNVIGMGYPEHAGQIAENELAIRVHVKQNWQARRWKRQRRQAARPLFHPKLTAFQPMFFKEPTSCTPGAPGGRGSHQRKWMSGQLGPIRCRAASASPMNSTWPAARWEAKCTIG